MTDEVPSISVVKAKALIEHVDQKVILIDVRPESEQLMDGRYPGATVTLEYNRQDKNGVLWVSDFLNWIMINKIHKTPNTTIILICKSGYRSGICTKAATTILSEIIAASDLKILNLTGGNEAWKAFNQNKANFDALVSSQNTLFASNQGLSKTSDSVTRPIADISHFIERRRSF